MTDLTNPLNTNPSLPEDDAGLVERLRGGKCPRCKGWGEISYYGEMVVCGCHGRYEAPISMTTRKEAAARIQSLSTALAEAREKDWQPIETAPKDGSIIDLWIDGEFPGRRPDVTWREPTDSEWWAHGGDTIDTPDATWHDMFGPLGKDEPPTHWMPRPDGPRSLTLPEGGE